MYDVNTPNYNIFYTLRTVVVRLLASEINVKEMSVRNVSFSGTSLTYISEIIFA